MKRFFSLCFLIVFALVQLVIPTVLAVDAPKLKDLKIEAPTEVNVNEAFNVTITAIGEDDKPLTKYEGNVVFETVTNEANFTFPKSTNPDDGDWGYQFQLSDQGVHTIEKGFTLKKAGDYEIDFIDLDSPPKYVIKTIKIKAVDKKPVETVKATITITEPSTNDTVSTSTVTVSGTSIATSKVNILLNGKQAASTQTDATGAFSTPLAGLTIGDNVIIAEVLGPTGTNAGSSAPVKLKYSTEAPKLTKLTIKEGDNFFAGSTVNLTAEGDIGLKFVQIKVGDKSAILEEDKTKPGTYTGKLKTSDFEWEFTASASIESQLGTKAEVPNLAKFRTITAKIENVKVETTKEKKVRFTFDLKPDVDQVQYFKIKYGNKSKDYPNSVITKQKGLIKENNQNTWYIPDLKPGEYFSTIIALDKDQNETPVTSGEQSFLISLDAAPTCYIDKVSGIQVKKFDTYSIISWSKLKEAASYQIFKRDASGEFAMIDEIPGTQLRVNINTSAKKEIFEDFKVRAICKNGNFTGEGAYSESVSVQTWPEMILLFALVLASGISFILMRRGYI